MNIAGLRFLRTTLWLICAACVAIPSLARPDETLDGRGYPVKDELLDSLVGSWKVIRTLHGQTFENTVQAEWVLEHQFLRLHYRDVASPAKYEAMAFIGYDHAAQSYIVHWIDVFGGPFSETLGFGKREGNAISLTFQYPDGTFENTFTFQPEAKTWISVMRQKDKAGEWHLFAENRFRRAAAESKPGSD